MNDDESPRRQPFTWGLRPSGARGPGEDRESVERGDNGEPLPEPASAAAGRAGQQPLDLGHLFATPQPYMDVATEAFTFHPQSALDAGAPRAAEPGDREPADTEPMTPPASSSPSEDLATEAFPLQQPEPPRSAVHPLVEPPLAHPQRSAPQPPAIDPALHGLGDARAREHALPSPEGEGAPTSALDALFNEREFELYTDESPVAVFVPHSNRSAASNSAGATEIAAPRPAKKPKALRAPRPATPPRGKGGHVSHQQKVLAWVAGALVAVLVLVGLFFLGTRLPAADPVAESTPTPTPTPSVTASAAPVAPAQPQAPVVPVATTGPVAPGPHAWDELLGTECLQPFVSAWEQEYTVVECGQAHTGQLVYRGRFAESALDPYPGVDGLQARTNPLCATPTNIDYGAASLYSDIQVSASFAGTQEAWAQGNRDYYCFVSRSSGQPFATNVATPPQPIVVIPVVAAPEP